MPRRLHVVKRRLADRPIRIPAEAHEHAKRLAAKVARDGWRSLGVDRDDLPTLGAVIQEALARIERS